MVASVPCYDNVSRIATERGDVSCVSVSLVNLGVLLGFGIGLTKNNRALEDWDSAGKTTCL
jgi:hypothetical protein